METKAQKAKYEEARWLSQRTTPRDEQLRRAYGSLEMSLQTVGGLCPLPRCLKKANHVGVCWPSPKEQ